MTPQERANAAKIQASIENAVRERRAGKAPQQTELPSASIPGITPPPPATTSTALRYAVVFAVALALHLAGFLAYRHHTEKRERETAARIAETQALALAELQAAAEASNAEAERLRQTIAQKPTPKIEYNVVKTQPQTRPQVVRQQTVRPSTPTQAAPDRTLEHQMTAQAYLEKKKGIIAEAISTKQVQGWDGRYRTQFEITRNPYEKTSSPRPRRYEVLTQERDGEITGIDVAIKW